MPAITLTVTVPIAMGDEPWTVERREREQRELVDLVSLALADSCAVEVESTYPELAEDEIAPWLGHQWWATRYSVVRSDFLDPSQAYPEGQLVPRRGIALTNPDDFDGEDVPHRAFDQVSSQDLLAPLPAGVKYHPQHAAIGGDKRVRHVTYCRPLDCVVLWQADDPRPVALLSRWVTP